MMDFTGAQGDFGLNNPSWGHAFDLARMYGWEPAGTLPPEEGDEECEWDGNYFYNSGQRVTDDDARNLAAALEKAIPDLPDHDALKHKKKRIGQSEEFGIPLGTPTNPFEWFSGEGKQSLRDFIVFCRAGGFEIW